jgi:quercetin dioxygenase-like cupin family protein
VALLLDLEAVGISETTAEPGGPPVPRHVHHRHAESFYVLEGEVVVTVDGGDLRVPAGGWITVPPGVVHALSLPGDTPVRFLNLHAPSAGFAAFVRALPETGGDATAAAARTPFDEENV